MKKLLMTCVPAVLLALPGAGHALEPLRINVGARAWLKVSYGNKQFNVGGNGLQAGPWYQYWPYEAHFVQPAPHGYPYYPPPMTLPQPSGYGYLPSPTAPVPVVPFAVPIPRPVPGGGGGPTANGPSLQPTAYQPATVQAVGYNHPHVPNYWYSR